MAPAGAGMPTKKCCRQAGWSRILDHHVETREPQRAGDREDHRRKPAQALHLVQDPDIEHERRRDAEIDEIGKRIELGAEPRRPVERARDASVEPVEHRRRRRWRRTAHSNRPSTASRIAVRPRHEREQRHQIGQREPQRHPPKRRGAAARSDGVGRFAHEVVHPSARLEAAQRLARSEIGDHRLAGDRARAEADERCVTVSGR